MKISEESWHYRFCKFISRAHPKYIAADTCSYTSLFMKCVAYAVSLSVVVLVFIAGFIYGWYNVITDAYPDASAGPLITYSVAFAGLVTFAGIGFLAYHFGVLITRYLIAPYIIGPVIDFLTRNENEKKKEINKESNSFIALLKAFKDKICHKIEYID